jgi:hypothetical protein
MCIDFNLREFVSTRRPTCYSEHDGWPDPLFDEEVKTHQGRVLKLPFAFWILENLRAAFTEINQTV